MLTTGRIALAAAILVSLTTAVEARRGKRRARAAPDPFEEVAMERNRAEAAVFAGQPVSKDFWVLAETLGPVYPQLQETGIGGNWDTGDPHSVYRLLRFGPGLPREVPPFGVMPLAPRATPTDLLSAAPLSGRGIVVNDRVRRVLAPARLGEHRFFPFQVTAGDRQLEYFWLHVANDQTRCIDFAASEFVISEMRIEKKGSSTLKLAELKFADLDALERKDKETAKTDEDLHIKSVVLRGSTASTPDLFWIQTETVMFISDRLKRSIEAAGLTGFRFEPTRRIRFAPGPPDAGAGC
jgi:hypothetical protein